MPTLSGTSRPAGDLVFVELSLTARDLATRPSPPLMASVVWATALLDTGADSTVVDEQVIAALAPAKLDMTGVIGHDAAILKFAVFALAMKFIDNGNIFHDVGEREVIAMPLDQSPYDVIIGRDILDVFTYNRAGPAKTFSLSYKQPAADATP